MTPRARTRGRVGEREDTAAGRVGERGSGSNDVSNMVAAERVNMTMQAPKIPLCNILQFEKGDMKGHAARTEAARFEAAVQAYDAAWQKISPGLRNSVSFQNCFTQPADAQTLAQAYCFLKGEGPEHWRNVMKFSIDETVALFMDVPDHAHTQRVYTAHTRAHQRSAHTRCTVVVYTHNAIEHNNRLRLESRQSSQYSSPVSSLSASLAPANSQLRIPCTISTYIHLGYNASLTTGQPPALELSVAI